MFTQIKRFLSELRYHRTKEQDLQRQIELGQQLRDMLSVARKLKLTIVMTVEIGTLRQGVLLAGDGPEAEWLYNFACGEVIAKQAERATDAKFGPQWKGRASGRDS